MNDSQQFCELDQPKWKEPTW